MATYAGKTYTNGNVPASLLAPLDGENYGDAVLRRDAAESWNRARAEVKAKTGIVLTVRGWNRTLAEQERFFFERYAPTPSGGTDIRWYKGVRYSRVRGAPAAIPGQSNHGWGLAVDVDDFGAYGTSGNARSRLATPILEKHGWTDDEGSSIGEPWHRVYMPERDQRKNSTPTQEDDMSAAAERQIDDLHRLLLRKFTDGDQTIDIVDGVRRDLIVDRRTEEDVNTLLVTNRALVATVQTLAKSVGIDPALVVSTLNTAVRETLSAPDFTIVLTPKEN
jgi:hypothetical protein